MLPASALRPFLFSKIHGIFSGFRSEEELISLFQSGSLEKALQELPIPMPAAGDTAQLSREYRLHTAFFMGMERLVPQRGAAGRFFAALMREYEARNVATWLKKQGLAEGDYFPLPERTWPLTGMLARTAPELGKKILQSSLYAKPALQYFEDNDPVALDRTLEQNWFQEIHTKALDISPRDRRAILPLLKCFLDIQSVLHAARLNRLYKLDPVRSTEDLFFPDKSRQQALRKTLTDANDDLTLLFPHSCRTGIRDILAGRPPSDEEQQDHLSLFELEQAAAQYLHRLFHKNFYQQHMTLGPLFCFYFLLKREILNTALLCNSIRFATDMETFRKELIHYAG